MFCFGMTEITSVDWHGKSFFSRKMTQLHCLHVYKCFSLSIFFFLMFSGSFPHPTLPAQHILVNFFNPGCNWTSEDAV